MCGTLGQTGWWLTVLRTILCGTGTFTTSPGVRVSPHARSLNHHDHLSQWGHTTPSVVSFFHHWSYFWVLPWNSWIPYLRMSSTAKHTSPHRWLTLLFMVDVGCPRCSPACHKESTKMLENQAMKQITVSVMEKIWKEGVLILNPRVLRNFRGTFLIQKYDIWKIWITSSSEHQKLAKSVH